MKTNYPLNIKEAAGYTRRLLLLFFLVLNLTVYGQRKRCGTDELGEELAKTDSTFIPRRDSLEKERLNIMNSPEYKKFKEDHIPPKESGSETSLNREFIFFRTPDFRLLTKPFHLIAFASS